MQFFPHASAIATSADLAELRRTLFLGTRLALAITAPIAVVVGVLAKPTLTVWVGPEFRQAGIVVGSLAATATIYAVTRIGTAILNATGHVRVPAWIDSFEALLNLSLSVFLGQAMGLGGVALATVIAASVSRLGLMLPYVCFRLKTTVHEVVRQLLRLLAAPLATASAIGVFFTSLHPTNVLEVMAIGASMAALYVLTLLVLGVSSSERREIVSVVRSRSLW
jgi:O-antigen/teichoic acid export membrane protein